MRKTKFLFFLVLFTQSFGVFVWSWLDLWQTPDQQGVKLLAAGNAQKAATVFENSDWRSVALYRANHFTQAFQQFSKKKTSDSQYNAGNAAAYSGRYQDAINAYDKAIALNANNADAVFNREIIKKLLDKQKQQKNSKSSTKNEKKDSKEKEKNLGQNDKQTKESDNSKDDNKEQKQAKQSESPKADNKSQEQAKSDPNQGKQEASEMKQTARNATLHQRTSDQEEEKKQLLRRVADNPGGLLQQKFLRDYFRRHANKED